MSADPTTAATPSADSPAEVDHRLYLPEHERFQVAVMKGAERFYCYQKSPGQDFYHLIVPGEIYIDSGDEMFCLECALRRGLVTSDRLFWQRRTL